jgi:hypothetical protein
MEARIVVGGDNAARVSLWDWLFDDPDLRDLLGRDAGIEVGGDAEYVVRTEETVAIWPVLARTLHAWINRWRVTVAVTGPLGRTATIEPGDPKSLVMHVFGVRELSTRG